MHLSRQATEAIVYKDAGDVEPDPAEGRSELQHLRERGTLRVGYAPDRLPLTFFNANGELVGFDVELATQLAEDLGLRLELVPVDQTRLLERLETGQIDVLPSIPYSVRLLDSLAFSIPYLESTLGFAVRDDRRHDFVSVESIRKLGRLRLGIPVDPELIEEPLGRYLSGVPLELVPMAGPRPFFEGRSPHVDALLVFAEVGMAWTLLHPEFSVVVPQPSPINLRSGFAVRPGDRELLEYLNEWITVQQSLHTFERAYEYWVLGRGAQQHKPRWSVLRNVLGWVE